MWLKIGKILGKAAIWALGHPEELEKLLQEAKKLKKEGKSGL